MSLNQSSPPDGGSGPSSLTDNGLTIGFATRRTRNTKKLSLNFVPHSRSLSLNAQQQGSTTIAATTTTTSLASGPPAVGHYRTPHSASAPTLTTPSPQQQQDIVSQTTTVTGTYDSEQKFKSYEFGDTNNAAHRTSTTTNNNNKKSSFLNGPICILPGLYLFSEPTKQIASQFDVIVNVAQEVANPYIGPSPTSSVASLSSSYGIESSSNDTCDNISDSSLSDIELATQPEYLHIPWQHNSAIATDFAHLTTAMYNAIKAGQKVLVHCLCGESRSPTLIIAYVMRLRDWDVNQAYSWVKDQAPIISPNMNFIYQLMEWNRRLKAGLTCFGNISSKPKITLMTSSLEQDAWVQRSAGAIDNYHQSSSYYDDDEVNPIMTPLSAPIRARRGFSLHESDSRRRDDGGGGDDNESILVKTNNNETKPSRQSRRASNNKRPRGYSEARGHEIQRSFSESVMCGFSASTGPSSIAVSPWI